MHDEAGPDGKRRYTVAQIAAEFGVTRPTIYRHLATTHPAARQSERG
jgi:predicted DNA-binding transcriptional regulator YafY